MAYSKNTWTDGTTPVDAERLNRMEAGISDCSDSIDELNGIKTYTTLRGTNVTVHYNDIYICFRIQYEGALSAGRNTTAVLLPDNISIKTSIYAAAVLTDGNWNTPSGIAFISIVSGGFYIGAPEAMNNALVVATIMAPRGYATIDGI